MLPTLRLFITGVAAAWVVGALLGLGSTTSAASSSVVSATSVVRDRTVLCTSSVFSGYRRVSVSFAPALRSSTPGTPASGAFAGVGSGGSNNGLNLAFVSAGPSVPKSRAVGIDAKRCKRVRHSVALSPRGLPAPPVRYLKAVDCLLKSVLVRVRAVVEGDRVIRGELVARTSNGRTPIAYARITADGSGALYYSSSCD